MSSSREESRPPIPSDGTYPPLVTPADIETLHDEACADGQSLVVGDDMAERREHGSGVILQIVPRPCDPPPLVPDEAGDPPVDRASEVRSGQYLPGGVVR